jgi:hypothetical protein
MLALKQKMKCHFMKWNDNILEGDGHQNDYLFLLSTSKFQLFFISRIGVEENFVENLQRQSREKL